MFELHLKPNFFDFNYCYRSIYININNVLFIEPLNDSYARIHLNFSVGFGFTGSVVVVRDSLFSDMFDFLSDNQ